jgi:hypothetical protein
MRILPRQEPGDIFSFSQRRRGSGAIGLGASAARACAPQRPSTTFPSSATSGNLGRNFLALTWNRIGRRAHAARLARLLSILLC